MGLSVTVCVGGRGRCEPVAFLGPFEGLPPLRGRFGGESARDANWTTPRQTNGSGANRAPELLCE
jgi:hypothetical protein